MFDNSILNFLIKGEINLNWGVKLYLDLARVRECDISAATTAGPMRGGLGPRGTVIGRAGGIWRVLAILTNGSSCVSATSRVGIQSRDGA